MFGLGKSGPQSNRDESRLNKLLQEELASRERLTKAADDQIRRSLDAYNWAARILVTLVTIVGAGVAWMGWDTRSNIQHTLSEAKASAFAARTNAEAEITTMRTNICVSDGDVSNQHYRPNECRADQHGARNHQKWMSKQRHKSLTGLKREISGN